MPLSEHLSALFAPRSIAVIGGPGEAPDMGTTILENLVNAGYEGKIFPVNLKGDTIRGLPVLRKPQDIPVEDHPLDLAVLCVPARECAGVLRDLSDLSLKAALLLYPEHERGPKTAGIEKELRDIALAGGITILGPGSLGLANSACHLNLTPVSARPRQGGIAFFSQSPVFGLTMYAWAAAKDVGISSFVTLGNPAFLTEADMLAYLAEDPHTTVITGYLENITDAQRFLHDASLAARKKPVILFKPGRTEEGARAASAHTGSRTGSDAAFDAACKKTGVIRAGTMHEVFDMARAFSGRSLPQGPGLAVIDNIGGPGAIAADGCVENGLHLTRFSPSTLEKLREALPSHSSPYNPVDVTAAATAEDIVLAVKTTLTDNAAHAVLVVVCPAPFLCMETLARELADIAVGLEHKSLLVCLMGGEKTVSAKRILRDALVPCYSFPEPAVRAIGAMYRHSQWKDFPLPVEIGYRHDKARAGSVIDDAKAHGIYELGEYYCLQILAAYEIPCLEAKLARTSDEAVQMAKQLGTPVALKIASPHVTHKSEGGGVALNLNGKDEVRAAFLDITGRARLLHKEAYIAGCMVQAMARKGAREAVIGFKRDAIFGPMVFFGLGGIHLEAFKDVSRRLAPLSLEDVHDMVREIRAFPSLAGIQGKRPVKFTALEDILLIMSQLATDFPEIQEVECNPVFADEQGAQVGDMRVLLTPPRSGMT